MKTVAGLWKALAVLVALAGAVAVSVRLVTFFGFWDDEGYMLVTLAHYVKQGHLYTQTFSQYGPFYFYAQGIFFQLLHLPVSHDMGRLATLVYWVVSSVLAAIFVHRAAKSAFLASAAGLCLMLVGLVLTNEPGHSQQVILLLYMIAACLSQLSLAKTRYSLALFLLGCVAAALVFTKINVGVFFVAGLAQTLICLLPWGKIRWLGIALTLLYAAAAPWLLMHAGFDRGFRGYCVVATVSAAVTLAFAALLRPDQPLPWRAIGYSAAGLLAGIALTVAATSLQGISMGSLISGVILAPMHHPKVFDLVLYIGGRQVLVALSLIATVVAIRLWGHRLADARWLDVLRCAVGMIAIFLLTLPGSTQLLLAPAMGDPLGVLADSSLHRIQWVVLLLPLTLIPQAHWQRNARALFSRLFITFMAVTQFMEAFPVAGSQLGIAAAPMILWAFLCVSDGIAGLRAASSKESAESTGDLGLDALMGGVILLVLAGISISLSIHSQFPPAPTKLKGTTWLHMPAKQTSGYESITQSVAANCGILFEMPGMGSFNMWSGVPTPNGWNLTAWMKGFSVERQAEILRILQADPQACAIVNRRIVHFWDKDDAFVASLPLAHYMTTEMPMAAQFGDYEIRVHPTRKSPWSPSVP
jgi:hypothetical protein